MKTYVVYGFGLTLVNALLLLGVYFSGYHTDPAKVEFASWIITPLSLVVSIVGIVLGTRARRAELPADEDFTYGRALGAAMMIVLFAALFGIVTNYLYFAVINPGLTELSLQIQTAKLEARGMPAAQVEKVEAMARTVMRPPIQAALGFVSAIIFGGVISLITSAFLQRHARDRLSNELR